MSASPKIGPRRTALPANRPAGFQAPYDAFEPRFAGHDSVVLVIFGLEVRGAAEDANILRERLFKCLEKDHGPDIREQGRTTDDIGPDAELYFTYWKSPAAYRDWCRTSGIEDLFADPGLLSGDVGLWREVCLMSLDHNETSSSRDEELTGLATFADQMAVTDLHGYWGSARDRIVAAADDSLDAVAVPELPETGAGLAQRITVRAPDNSCLIRSSQDVSRTNEGQKEMFMSSVRPALLAGLDYLKNNPAESGCAGVRFVKETGNAGVETGRSCVLGFFSSLGTLEAWTHHHPTHGAIMGSFIAMVENWQGQPGLDLWHEVTVFPAGTLYGDYVNCSSEGTLMAFGLPVTETELSI